MYSFGYMLQGLPEVFDPRGKPWVKINSASTEVIIDQVKKCPSAALSFFMNNNEEISK
jgi:uncharacterized Fe-S cluster protein YjdI